MAGLTLRADIEQVVANAFARPAVERIRDEAADQVRRHAPPAKVWVTARDERVRPTHVETDSQMIPDNLRYRVPHPRLMVDELARGPRDPDLSPGNREGCRCQSFEVRDAIARTVTTSPAMVTGPTVRASVSATFARLVESEYPSAGDERGGWFRQALRDTAAATRARSGRI